jgi:hypothetical protein
MEVGCVMGNTGNFMTGFRWFPGDPTIARNIFGVFMVGSEEVGTFELLKGAYMKGSRCRKCRKLFLDY